MLAISTHVSQLSIGLAVTVNSKSAMFSIEWYEGMLVKGTGTAIWIRSGHLATRARAWLALPLVPELHRASPHHIVDTQSPIQPGKVQPCWWASPRTRACKVALSCSPFFQVNTNWVMFLVCSCSQIVRRYPSLTFSSSIMSSSSMFTVSGTAPHSSLRTLAISFIIAFVFEGWPPKQKLMLSFSCSQNIGDCMFFSFLLLNVINFSCKHIVSSKPFSPRNWMASTLLKKNSLEKTLLKSTITIIFWENLLQIWISRYAPSKVFFYAPSKVFFLYLTREDRMEDMLPYHNLGPISSLLSNNHLQSCYSTPLQDKSKSIWLFNSWATSWMFKRHPSLSYTKVLLMLYTKVLLMSMSSWFATAHDCCQSWLSTMTTE